MVSEQDYSSQGGIVLQDENARVHLGHLCLNYNLALLDFFTKCYTKEIVLGHVGEISVDRVGACWGDFSGSCRDMLGRFQWIVSGHVGEISVDRVGTCWGDFSGSCRDMLERFQWESYKNYFSYNFGQINSQLVKRPC